MAASNHSESLFKRIRKSRWALALVPALVAVVLAGLLQHYFAIFGRPATSPAVIADTAKITYVGYTENGALAEKVTRTSGRCFAPAITTPRTDAFRCQALHQVFDPCFSNPLTMTHLSSVICPNGPFQEPTVLIKLSPELPYSDQNYKDFSFTQGDATNAPSALVPLINDPDNAWGLLLSNGETCVSNSYEALPVANQDATYICSTGRSIFDSQNGEVIGDILPGNGLWHVNYLPYKSNVAILVTVDKSWF